LTPNGRSAFVANENGGNNVSQYKIAAKGRLVPVKKHPTALAGSMPTGIAVTPNGLGAYATNDGSQGGEDAVSQYGIHKGQLSPLTPATVFGGKGPSWVAVTPDGLTAYVTNFFNDSVSAYAIDPTTSALTFTAGGAQAGIGPEDVAVSADGKSAYVTNREGTISQYTIEPGGALKEMTPATVATAERPVGIVATP
jgi:YVTN family beta-propeller protein